MDKSVFDAESQQDDVASKIVVGLERISEVFRTLLWEQAKVVGISPIQIQILIFIGNHTAEMCNISHLAQEFNLTKPTISDAVKTLESKDYIIKNHSKDDGRKYSIALNEKGKALVQSIGNFANPIKDQLGDFNNQQLNDLFESLSALIFKLNKSGVLSVQRMCYACSFYENKSDGHYCGLLKKPISNAEIRLDCPEFEVPPV